MEHPVILHPRHLWLLPSEATISSRAGAERPAAGARNPIRGAASKAVLVPDVPQGSSAGRGLARAVTPVATADRGQAATSAEIVDRALDGTLAAGLDRVRVGL